MASYDPDFHGVDPGKETWPADAEPRRRGCLFYGCVGVVVLSVLLMLALALAALVSYRTIVRYRDMYTSEAPVELPKLATSEEDRARAVARVEAFREAVESGAAVGPLSLSGDDLNALIQESPRLKDHVFLSIVGDEVKAKVSIPLTELKDLSLTRGRYLNGEAELKVALRDGRVRLEVVSMLAEGKELPPMVRDILARSDIVLDDDDDDEDDTDDDRRLKGFLRRIESLEVKDGAMIVTPRPPAGAAPPPAPGPPPGPAAPPATPPTPPPGPPSPAPAPLPEGAARSGPGA